MSFARVISEDIPNKSCVNIFDLDAVRIDGKIGSEATVNHSGSGALFINGQIGSAATINYSGAGELFISGEVNSRVSLNLSGIGKVIISGKINPRVVCEAAGIGDVIITGEVGEHSVFNRSSSGCLIFNKRPPESVVIQCSDSRKVIFTDGPIFSPGPLPSAIDEVKAGGGTSQESTPTVTSVAFPGGYRSTDGSFNAITAYPASISKSDLRKSTTAVAGPYHAGKESKNTITAYGSGSSLGPSSSEVVVGVADDVIAEDCSELNITASFVPPGKLLDKVERLKDAGSKLRTGQESIGHPLSLLFNPANTTIIDVGGKITGNEVETTAIFGTKTTIVRG